MMVTGFRRKKGRQGETARKSPRWVDSDGFIRTTLTAIGKPNGQMPIGRRANDHRRHASFLKAARPVRAKISGGAPRT